MIGAFVADRVCVRLSPGGTFNDMKDGRSRETLAHALRELDGLRAPLSRADTATFYVRGAWGHIDEPEPTG